MQHRSSTRAVARVARILGIAGVVAGSLLGTAEAQVPDVPDTPELPLPGVPAIPVPPAPQLPITELPDDVDPALVALAPLTNVACRTVGSGPGTVTYGLGLTGTAASLLGLPPVGVPTAVYSYILLPTSSCGLADTPSTISECEADRQVAVVTDEVYGTGAGIAAVFLPVPAISSGVVFDTAVAAEDVAVDQGVPVPAGASDTLYDQAGCEDTLGDLSSGLDEIPAPTDDATTDGAASGSSAPAPVVLAATADRPEVIAVPVQPISFSPGSSSGSSGSLAAPSIGSSEVELAQGLPVSATLADASDRWPLWRKMSLLLLGAGLVALAALIDRSARRSLA